MVPPNGQYLVLPAPVSVETNTLPYSKVVTPVRLSACLPPGAVT
jgi:hypothetical protein